MQGTGLAPKPRIPLSTCSQPKRGKSLRPSRGLSRYSSTVPVSISQESSSCSSKSQWTSAAGRCRSFHSRRRVASYGGWGGLRNRSGPRETPTGPSTGRPTRYGVSRPRRASPLTRTPTQYPTYLLFLFSESKVVGDLSQCTRIQSTTLCSLEGSQGLSVGLSGRVVS